MKESQAHIRQLINENNTKDDVIPFIGAGLSVSLGLPTWESLVKEYFDKSDCQNTGHTFENIKNECDSDWAKVAEKIFISTGSNSDLLNDFLTERFQPSIIPFTAVHSKLIHGFSKIITTNYDSAFELCIRDKERQLGQQLDYKYLYFPDLPPMEFNGNAIAYLHGHVATKNYVLKESDYNFAYTDNQEISDFMKAVLKTKNLLFFGFSFNDHVFNEKLKTLFIQIEKEKKDKLSRFGPQSLRNASTQLYVVIHSKEVKESITEDDISSIEIGMEELEELFHIKNEDGEIDLFPKDNKPNIDFWSQVESKFKDKTKNLKWLFDNLKSCQERKKYFTDLGFNLIKFNSGYISIPNIIDQIIYKEVEPTSEDLPSTF